MRAVTAAVLVAFIAAGLYWFQTRGGGQGQERYAVRWQSIELAEDRHSITATASYPLAGFCVKKPDGVDVRVDGEVAVVAVWMTGPAPHDGLSCTTECGFVSQTVELNGPLPPAVQRFEPVDHAVEGCG